MEKIVIAQGGGPTAVINQSLAGIVEAAQLSGVKTILGAKNGIEGLEKKQFIELTQTPTSLLNAVAQTPGSALGSTRIKPDAKGCGKIVEALKREKIDAFFYIGGNDTSSTLAILESHNPKTVLVHVPKTIDNDLVLNDHTPGYGSAALYVATAFGGLNYDQKSLAGVHIGVTMGRHAGFLTAASAAFRNKPDDGPHIVIIPEVPISLEELAKRVKECHKKYGRCLIALSEGAVDENQNLLGASQSKDSHGNVQLSGSGALGDKIAELLRTKIGIKRVRSDTLGYMQRAFGMVSKRDSKEAHQIGVYAFREALSEEENFSATINLEGSESVFGKEKLAAVGGKTRTMPPHFFDETTMLPTEECLRWIRLMASTENNYCGL